jgi:two-component system response regulator HydG
MIVNRNYGQSLLQAMTAQARDLAHAVALEATERVLINDRVALQKMFNHQRASNPVISYIFIIREGEILAHTFAEGIPIDLIEANRLDSGEEFSLQKIVSKQKARFLDIAWPIFEGRAGILRMGFSEEPYRRQVTHLWLDMSGLTLAILLLALGGSLLFLRRIFRPLDSLSEATARIDKGELNVRVPVEGQDELGNLAVSFNHMVARVEEYTQKLEEQTLDLERAHHQTRTFCGIVQEIGALRTLSEIGRLLIGKFQAILVCKHMVLLVCNANRDIVFSIASSWVKKIDDERLLKQTLGVLEEQNRPVCLDRAIFEPPLVPEEFCKSGRQAVVPLVDENDGFGALVIACDEECRCEGKEAETVGAILAQAGGVIRRAVVQEEEQQVFRDRIEAAREFNGMVGKDPKMHLVYRLIEDIAHTDATVLIQGESGTGKELVARAIHRKSQRKNKPFVVINCSAYPATLLESEIFGHEKGAFTGAIRQKAGRFEQAHDGTVFLDEIGEISPSAQIKLLRVLQTKKFERLGGEQTLSVDVRILAATNKDLLAEVKKGSFREDLFYRLNVIPVHLPPLRDRRNDIPLLARHFLRHFAAEHNKEISEFSPEAMRLLLDHGWPGNVRELENTVEHAVVLARGENLEAAALPGTLRPAASGSQVNGGFALVEQEKRLLEQTLESCGWNKKEAARRLGIGRSTLYEKLKRFEITSPTRH